MTGADIQPLRASAGGYSGEVAQQYNCRRSRQNEFDRADPGWVSWATRKPTDYLLVRGSTHAAGLALLKSVNHQI